MSKNRWRNPVRLEPCPTSCQCLCHDGFQQHWDSPCEGKLLTNTPEAVAAYREALEVRRSYREWLETYPVA